MKKFFAIAFIAAAMVACNNSSEGEKKVEDTPAVKIDTPAVATPDSPAVKMDSPAVKVDTPAVK